MEDGRSVFEPDGLVTHLAFRYSLAQLLDISGLGEVVVKASFFETVVIRFSTITGNGN